ncbi:hypothetical protein [Streptomyces sp. NBC_00304]|uniref:hypothetical protein n=1 Tax=Streptomyces sp. NBC_00304 TaxID=2975706 RepID=UPI002E2B578A|nr:hypothetical protein [Streptomyces sp. NBC_00304]
MADEIERQEREDTDLGPEPEDRFVLRAGRWVRVEQEALSLPSLLPPGFAPVVERGTEPGSDEIRARVLMIAAQDRYGWARCGGSL